MPEGPEVRREADQIGAVLAGQRLAQVQFGLPRLERFAQVLRGQQVTSVTSRGKAMLVFFANGLTLFSHNQLYGKWVVCQRGKTPQTRRSLRVALHTDSHSALLFSASNIEVLDDVGLANHAFLQRLGPDVLDDTLQWQVIYQRLQEESWRGRSLAALYLDQHFLAGVGNYLRSEILFAAQLAPHLRPRQLEAKQLRRLARATLRLCQRAYQTGGVTNPPQRVARLKRQGAKRAAHRFAVFGRAERECYVCGSLIQRISVASRRLYYCPQCQGSAD